MNIGFYNQDNCRKRKIVYGTKYSDLLVNRAGRKMQIFMAV